LSRIVVTTPIRCGTMRAAGTAPVIPGWRTRRQPVQSRPP
jgi:hypothetical protein